MSMAEGVYRQQAQSVEQSLESAKRSKAEFNQAIMDAASAVVRYAANFRPIQNPHEFLAVVENTLESCALSTIQRIDPQTGRVRGEINSQTQAVQQAQLQAWRQIATTTLQQQPRSRRNRSNQRQLSLT